MSLYILYASIFLAPWQGLDLELGLRLSCYRIFIALLLIASLGSILKRSDRTSSFQLTVPFGAFLVYSVLISLALIPSLPEIEVSGGSLRAPAARAIGQIVYFIGILVGPLLVIPMCVKHEHQFIVAAKCYLWSLIILACLGWFQLLAWYGTGWNPFPIGLLTYSGDPSLLREGTFAFAGLPIHRMSSLGGEPKNLGHVLAIGLILIQALWFNNSSMKTEKRLFLTWILLFSSMALTYSTSSTILWLLGSGTQILISTRRQGKVGNSSRKARAIQVIFVIAFLVTAFSLVAIQVFGEIEFTQLLKERTTERIGIEDFDEAIFNTLVAEPKNMILGMGLGNAHLYAEYFLPVYALGYAQGTAFRAKTGILKVLSEVGAVGLVLWTIAIIAQLSRLRHLKRHVQLGIKDNGQMDNVSSTLFQLGASLFIAYFALSGFEEILFLVLGFVLAADSIVRSKWANNV